MEHLQSYKAGKAVKVFFQYDVYSTMWNCSAVNGLIIYGHYIVILALLLRLKAFLFYFFNINYTLASFNVKDIIIELITNENMTFHDKFFWLDCDIDGWKKCI